MHQKSYPLEQNNPSIFFSVVIPTYNRASIITDTIQSVLQQDFKDFEIIVIDDGSKDQTQSVIANIQDPRLHYFYQSNKERSAARNEGIRQAKGTYICFLDSDDRYETNHLSTLYHFIEKQKNEVALFFCDHFCLQNGKLTEAVIAPFDAQNPVMYFLYHPVIPARVCIHHSILEKYRFDERIVIVEDLVLWVHIALHYPVYHIDVKTVWYHLHESNSVNISNNAFGPRLRGLEIFFKEKEITKAIPSSDRRSLIGDCHFGIARHYEFKRNFLGMLKHLILSFVYTPKHPQNRFKLYMIYRYLLGKKGDV